MSSIYDAVVNALHQVRKESPEIPQAGEKEPLTRGQRLRVVERIKRHIGLAWAGISEDEFVAFRNFKNNNSNDV
jgi:hypothetical protein